jgi:hypothetical protein
MWPLAMGAARLDQFRRGRRRSRPCRARGGGHAHLGLIGARSLGETAPDGGARRWPAATAAAGYGSCEGAQCRANERRHTPLRVLGSRLGWLAGPGY